MRASLIQSQRISHECRRYLYREPVKAAMRITVGENETAHSLTISAIAQGGQSEVASVEEATEHVACCLRLSLERAYPKNYQCDYGLATHALSRLNAAARAYSLRLAHKTITAENLQTLRLRIGMNSHVVA